MRLVMKGCETGSEEIKFAKFWISFHLLTIPIPYYKNKKKRSQKVALKNIYFHVKALRYLLFVSNQGTQYFSCLVFLLSIINLT